MHGHSVNERKDDLILPGYQCLSIYLVDLPLLWDMQYPLFFTTQSSWIEKSEQRLRAETTSKDQEQKYH